jgi:hypothetical protein
MQEPRRAGDRGEAVLVEGEAAHGGERGVVLVEHVDEVLVDGDADGSDPAGRRRVQQHRFAVTDGEGGDAVRAGVDGKHGLAVVGERDGALRSEAAAGPDTSRGHAACRGE